MTYTAPLTIDGKTVTFGEKNFFQKPNCLWPQCPNGNSVQEARYAHAAIRCCKEPECIRWAAEFAIRAAEAVGGPAQA